MSERTMEAVEPVCPECGGIDREYEHRVACSRGLSPMHRQVERQYPEILRANAGALGRVPMPEMSERTMEFPRRHNVDRMTPAERAIADAVQAVEALPADERLTRAVILLGQAREAVADYVDGINPEAPHA